MEIETNSLWILSLLWWGVQVIPPIVSYIKNWDSIALADSLASFDISLPSFFEPLLKKVTNDVYNFKMKTNRKWNYLIWKNGRADITI